MSTELERFIEAWSSAAYDASTAHQIQADLLRLISAESDEIDQVELLKRAYSCVADFITQELGEIGGEESEDEASEAAVMHTALREWRLTERYVSTAKRKELAGKGQALKDGSYPIENEGDLENAAHLAKTGHGNVSGAKALISKMAKKLGVKNPLSSKESSAEVELSGDIVPLVEGAVRADGTARIKIIQPGWGSSGYYSESLLKGDGTKVFGPGTKMYWDHPTAVQEKERPERSLRDLAAEITSTATYDENGPKGAGLYADAKVFGPYREAVQELAPHIGVSIRAMGTGKQGTVEGRSGRIIEQLVSAQSVDFVTQPGAGGQVLSLFESARGGREPSASPQKEVPNVDELAEARRERDESRTQLQEAQRENARLLERLVLREAKDMVATELRNVKLPDITKTRLAETIALNPPMKDGQLDENALKVRIGEAVRSEAEYIAKLTESGRVRGFGADDTDGGGVKLEEGLLEVFTGLGLSESVAKAAARGRVA